MQYDTNQLQCAVWICQAARLITRLCQQARYGAQQQVIAEHQRCFKKHSYHFEPWHYVSLLAQKPGALRDGAPFEHWDLPKTHLKIKKIYLQQHRGDRDFVQLLQLIQAHDVDTISMACELGLKS